jgi:hypothetical protein
MNRESSVKPLSDAIATPILKAYKAGGFGLVFVFVGTLLLLVALFFGEGLPRYIAAAVGTLMIFFVLVLFYFQDIKKLQQASVTINRNAELVDTIQQTAIEMTDLASHLQSLAFKHADEVAVLITQIRERLAQIKSLPIVSGIPGIDKIAAISENKHIVRANDLAASIVKSTETAKEIIKEVRIALVECDPKRLSKYLTELRALDEKTKALLTGQTQPSAQPDPRPHG